MNVSTRTILSATGLLLAAAAAQGASTLTAIVDAFSSTSGGPGDNVTGPHIYNYTIDAVPTNAQSQIEYLVQQTTATYPISGENLYVSGAVGGTAGLGNLHAYANTEGHSDGTNRYYSGYSTAEARMSFTDTIMVSPTAAHQIGDWVTVNAKLVVEKTIAYGPQAEVVLGATLNLWSATRYDAQDESGNPFGNNNKAYNSFHVLNQVIDNRSLEVMVGQFKVGATYTIYGSLRAMATSPVGNTWNGYLSDSWATVDARNTSHSYFWSDDPTVLITTGSGQSYAPVPEPTSLAALVLCTSALLARRRAVIVGKPA